MGGKKDKYACPKASIKPRCSVKYEAWEEEEDAGHCLYNNGD